MSENQQRQRRKLLGGLRKAWAMYFPGEDEPHCIRVKHAVPVAPWNRGRGRKGGKSIQQRAQPSSEVVPVGIFESAEHKANVEMVMLQLQHAGFCLDALRKNRDAASSSSSSNLTLAGNADEEIDYAKLIKACAVVCIENS